MDNLHENDPTRVDLQRYTQDALALLQNYMNYTPSTESKVHDYCQGTGNKQSWPRRRLMKGTVKISADIIFVCVCDIV